MGMTGVPAAGLAQPLRLNAARPARSGPVTLRSVQVIMRRASPRPTPIRSVRRTARQRRGFFFFPGFFGAALGVTPRAALRFIPVPNAACTSPSTRSPSSGPIKPRRTA